MDNIGPQSSDELQKVNSMSTPQEGVVENIDPISLDIDDTELVKIIDQRIDDSNSFYEKNYNLKARRLKNETYLFGRQLDEKEKNKELKTYETRNLDNVLYEIESSLKPLAMSHLPDMIVLPGTDDPEKKQSADDLTVVINETNKRRKQRKVLALGFKHLPTYFTGVIKAVWNADLKDFEFKIVHPNNIIADHTAKSNDADDMNFIAETLPVTVQDLFMRFPTKKDDLIEALKKDGVNLEDEQKWKDLATEVNITEVHFTWYKKKGEKVNSEDLSIYEPGVKWEKVEGVMWKYKTVLLDKMLTPNFDHEGEEVLYTIDPQNPDNKIQLKPEDMVYMMMSGQYPDIQKERIFHNYFKNPRKPYFFFGYDQWGNIPYDETSRIEQNIRNQENLDIQGKTIIDQLRQRIKHLWSKESGLKSADIQKMDMDNPNLDVIVDGDLTKVHTIVQPERPDAPQYKSKEETSNRMYAISGANAIRGQLQSDVATTNQIAREADFTRADDLVEDTINSACEWMSEWQMQFVKLRYTEDHLKQILGKSGSVTYLKLRRDMISDGMEVTVKSSSTDKLKAQKNAMEMAKSKLIDPMTFYEDMDMTDPKGRTEKLLLFNTAPELYLTKFVMGLETTPQLAGALNQAPPPTPEAAGVPQNPSPVDTANVASEPPVGVEASPNNGII